MTHQKITTYHVVLFSGILGHANRPFGAHKVAHELRLHGFDTLVVNHTDLFSTDELITIVDHVVSDKTLFVGLSNTFFDSSYQTGTFYNNLFPQGTDCSELVVQHIKNKNQNCKIVVGGAKSHANYHNPLVDYVVLGYADISAVQLAKHLAFGTPISVNHYKNLYHVQILDDKVAAGFDFNNSSMQWTADDIIVKQETLPLEISRGCIFKCKFCNYILNGKNSVSDYVKNKHQIYSELIDNYEKYGITQYRLLDDTFNDSEEKIDMMLDIVKSLPFQPLFWAYVRLDILSAKPHTIRKLYDIGIREMFFGIETLNRSSGSIIGKGGDPDRMIQTLFDIKKSYQEQVTIAGSFICGLPDESKSSVENTMDRLITKQIPLDLAYYYPLMIVKKSHFIWDSAFGIDYKKYNYLEVDDSSVSKIPFVNWKNQHMTFKDAHDLTEKFGEKFNHGDILIHKKLHGMVLKTTRMHNTEMSTKLFRKLPSFQKYRAELFRHVGITEQTLQ